MNTRLAEKAKSLRDKEGKLDEAITLLETNISTISPEEEPSVLAGLASLYMDTNRIDDAIFTHQKAIDSAKREGNNLILADSLRRMGWEMWQKDKDPKAYRLQSESWEITKNHLDDRSFQMVAANIWAALGNFEFDSGNLDIAKGNYDKAMEYAEMCDFKERICTLNGDFGNVYVEMSEYEKAEEYLKNALEYALENYHHAIPSSRLRLAKLYKLQGKIDEAKKQVNKALDVSIKEGWKRDEEEVREMLKSFK